MKKIIANSKADKRKKLHKKIRAKISGTGEVPRLAVFKSNRFIYAQIINDDSGKVLASASDLKTYLDAKINKVESAKKVGLELAESAKKANIKKVVFDRGGFPFKGRVKALAEGAREGGLEF
ncbi:50S ribosomal protein L18 [bioreactor metagenome]|uniref:50S ribosomal protein L18 n=1 Tax=bioreactor metagenome TaxID=1076179 RepID=A0A644T662_9ZZZZ|nr:50S ribosomal protein L18 [Candidatus Elulimicrobiales bacterium]